MKALILAGGFGTRLWPHSRTHFPKQFLKMQGQSSFLQKTVERNLSLVAPKDLFVMTQEVYYSEVAQQIKEIDPQLETQVLVEPEGKNTAPAIALALQLIPNLDSKEVVFITPSDHILSPLEKYVTTLKEGEKLAQEGFLVTFGIRPSRAETGYGYVKAQDHIVEKFVEKPDLKTAQKYLESGDYFWNSGIFAFTKEIFDIETEKHAKELFDKPFDEMPSISIDYALLEKSKKVAMISLDLSWSDVGSWKSFYEMEDKDDDHNVLLGDVMAIDTTNSLIYADKRLVSTIGLDNIVIIETEDVVLVADKNKSERVKEIVNKLKTNKKSEADEPLTSHRPWGKYTVLTQGERHKIKKIIVNPQEQLSLQMHYHRSEHWVVVSGTAKVTINSEESIVHEGQSIFVPKSAIHRLENPGKVTLELIEVQVGEYLGEDDILRFEDIYGRLSEKAFKKLLDKTGKNQ